jgi:hypothetical protein
VSEDTEFGELLARRCTARLMQACMETVITEQPDDCRVVTRVVLRIETVPQPALSARDDQGERSTVLSAGFPVRGTGYGRLSTYDLPRRGLAGSELGSFLKVTGYQAKDKRKAPEHRAPLTDYFPTF